VQPLPREIVRFIEQDAKLVEAARHIKVLSALGWPAETAEEFLRGYEQGNPKLPVVTYPKVDLSSQRKALADIARMCDPAHPIGRYLNQTANSYIAGARMLESVGTKAFRELSEALYGSPSERLGRHTNLQMAEDFIKITGDFAASLEAAPPLECLSPELVAYELKRHADEFFTSHDIQIVIDPHLAAKAAAGAERVRIRGLTRFSQADVDQLLQHELFVHSATMLSGRAQPYFKSLGLGAPRTTGTQEGIATFAELITATMDLSRLRRIALRIKGIHLACEGGDFIETFRFFVDSGQSPSESFQSAARIFRGGDVRGTHVFTKDVVYLKGLFSVHTFMRKAIEARKIDYPKWLFIGRLALGDLISLEPFIDRGIESSGRDGVPLIRPPLYLPRWVANRDGLAAYLSYAVFANRLNLAEIRLEDFVSDLKLEDLEGPHANVG
jgi:uncharacterized protein (TIGR02421 family)